MNTKSISPLLLTAVFFLLLFMTAVSFHFGRIHYESYDNYLPLPVYLAHLNDAIVIGVAFLQAILVLTFFMKLVYGRVIHTVFILGSTALICVFCIFLLSDSFYRGAVDPLEGKTLKTAVEIE